MESADAVCIESDRKGGKLMLTLSEFIAVLSLCIASFTLGYRIGRDRSSDQANIKQK